jgi:hypothetical protein
LNSPNRLPSSSRRSRPHLKRPGSKRAGHARPLHPLGGMGPSMRAGVEARPYAYWRSEVGGQRSDRKWPGQNTSDQACLGFASWRKPLAVNPPLPPFFKGGRKHWRSEVGGQRSDRKWPGQNTSDQACLGFASWRKPLAVNPPLPPFFKGGRKHWRSEVGGQNLCCHWAAGRFGYPSPRPR